MPREPLASGAVRETVRTPEGRLRARITCTCGHTGLAPFACDCGEEYQESGQRLNLTWRCAPGSMED